MAGLHLPAGIGLIALIAANAYTVLFNLSWGPVMWVLLGEMFPNQIRGSALAVSGAAQWLCNFLVSLSFPWLAANLGLAADLCDLCAEREALSLWVRCRRGAGDAGAWSWKRWRVFDQAIAAGPAPGR